MTKFGTARVAAMLVMFAGAGTSAIAADMGGMTDYVRVNRAAVTPSDPAGAQRSLGLLGAAAMEACGASFFSLPEYKDAVRRSACWHESMTDAVSRIDNQYLTAAYQRRATVEVADSRGGAATHAR